MLSPRSLYWSHCGAQWLPAERETDRQCALAAQSAAAAVARIGRTVVQWLYNGQILARTHRVI